MDLSFQFPEAAYLTPEETVRCTQWTGGWVDPRADVDLMKTSKIIHLPGIEPQQSVAHVTVQTGLFWLAKRGVA
jgi:hypothetical protein